MSSLPDSLPDSLPEALRDRLPELMRAAIAEARRGDEPFGCALADFRTGELLGSAANSAASEPTAHAEINGLRLLADRKLAGREVLLVSTAEPCPMCASACWWAGVRGVVYGTTIADIIRFGWRQIDLPCREVWSRTHPPSPPTFWGGYLTEETDPLYLQGPPTK
jgi:tRNA(adenine34) deaminase